MIYIFRSRIFLFLSVLLFSSCAIFIPGYHDYSVAKKNYKIGNYDSAVFYVSNSLGVKPNNQKGITLLELAYPLAVNRHQTKIDMLTTIKDDSKWPDLVHEYEVLQKLGH
ncbi:hypothetical protein JYT44_02670 [Caldithrix abyssi]|nr:hypothetical protein [Caldithrix abyssi]